MTSGGFAVLCGMWPGTAGETEAGRTGKWFIVWQRRAPMSSRTGPKFAKPDKRRRARAGILCRCECQEWNVTMSFIKLWPLEEAEHLREEDFGRGHPARCLAQRRFAARELYLNIQQIAAFGECPRYLSCTAEPNALVNGIRIRLVSGDMLVVAYDLEEDEPGFLTPLQRAAHGEVAESGYSRYLHELERQGLV